MQLETRRSSDLTVSLTDGNNKWTIGINEYSWHNAPAYTLYVDQPVGTGLSYSKKGNYCKNDFEVSNSVQVLY